METTQTTKSRSGIVIAIIIIVLILIYALSRGDKTANQTGTGNGVGTQTNMSMLLGNNQTPITTKDIEYFPGAKGYYAKPQTGTPTAAVVLIHENRGLRPEIKTMTEELAKVGYQVLAVDLFGKVVETQDEARQLTASFDQQKGIENMKAAVKYLRDNGAVKIASLGWCFGGGQSLQLGLSGEKMDATLLYYGRLGTTTPEQLAPIKWPVLGVFGGADTVIPVESVNKFDSTLDQLGIENEIYIYPGVGHAFANPSGMNFAPEETKNAWAKTTDFLKRHLQ